MQNLRLTYDEIARLREKDLKNLLQHKKLYLVLDLDHTLLNSTRISDISAEEEYLKDTLPGVTSFFSFYVSYYLLHLHVHILFDLFLYIFAHITWIRLIYLQHRIICTSRR